MNLNQCMAPNGEKRCNHMISENSDRKYCEMHNPKAHKLYKRYKKLTALLNDNHPRFVDDYHPVSEKLEYIKKSRKFCLAAHAARIKHMNEMVYIECQDDGHHKKIEKISHLISLCNDKINLYQSMLSISDDNNTMSESSSETESYEDFNDTPNIEDDIEKISFMEIQNEYIDNKIIENEEMLQHKKLLIRLIEINILKIFNGVVLKQDVWDRYKIILAIVLYNIVRTCNFIGYFQTNFSPSKCRCNYKECDGYMKYKIFICKPGIDTIDNIITCDYNELFRTTSEEDLKQFYGSLITNLQKIKILVTDFLNLSILHTLTVLVTNHLSIRWNSMLNRYMLTSCENRSKIHRLVATTRKKHNKNVTL